MDQEENQKEDTSILGLKVDSRGEEEGKYRICKD